MVTRRPAGLPRDEQLVVHLLFVLALVPAWLRGGTHGAWSWPLLILAPLVLAVLVVLSIRRHRAPPEPGLSAPGTFVPLRDPVFWAGLVLLLLLFVQWWNAGRVLFYDSAARAWSYSPPRIPFLPSAITPAEARQMLDWFVPAWVLVVALRAPGLSGRGVRQLWRLLVWNAAALSLFGIVQYASGTTQMYGFLPMRPHFFASFGYPNHAGSYFLLTMCLAAGLLSYDLARGGHWVRPALLGGAFFLALAGANLALSRLSILLSWLLLAPIGWLLLRPLWSEWTMARRLNSVLAGLAVLALAAVLTVGLAREDIRREFKPENDQKTFLDRETSFRGFQIKAAALIWKDAPWWGVGGWGYRYLLAHYLPESEWRRITEGKANVHNDPMQFLAEFGVVGFGAMATVVILLARRAWRPRMRLPPLVLLPLLGCALVGLQSLIDLPFRSPAVLALWLVLLAGAGRVWTPRRTAPAAGKNGATLLNVPGPVASIPAQRSSP